MEGLEVLSMVSVVAIPPELQTPPPRQREHMGGLRLKPAPKVRDQILGALVVPALFIGWAALRDGADADFLTASVIGLGLDAFLFLFVLGLSVQRRRAALIFREGVTTTGRVCQTSTSADGTDAALGFLEVEYHDATGCPHVGRFSTVGAASDQDVRTGAAIPVLYLSTKPRVCAFYSAALGLVPGRASS